MKLAIVTGSSRGLGCEIARELLDRGNYVYGLSRTNAAVLKKHPNFKFCKVDLRKPFSHLPLKISKSVEEVILVHNASSVEPISLIRSWNAKQVSKSLQTNLIAAIELSLSVAKTCERVNRPLKILFVSSPAAFKAIPGINIYCVAKAGLEMFNRSLESESEFFKVAVKTASFNPGRMDTQMQKTMRSASSKDFPPVQMYREFHTNKQLRSAHEVAKNFCQNLVDSAFESGKHYSVEDFLNAQ